MNIENNSTYLPSNLERAILLAAFVAPGALAFAFRATEASSDLGAPPTAKIGMAISALWIVFACLPPLRQTLIATGSALLSRLSFTFYLVIAALSGFLTTTEAGGELALMTSCWAVMLAFAAMLKAWSIDARQTIFRGIILGISIVFVLLLDVLVGLYVLPAGEHNSVSVVHEPVLGWKLRPNQTIVRRKSGLLPVTETINDLGFRFKPRSIEKPSDTFRIIVLGDSHTEAIEVSDGETWCELLEKEFRKTRSVEVIPFGVAGWSTDQQLLAYLYYARQFSPDLVILQMTHNDIVFNSLDTYWRGRKPWFERHGNVLVLQGVPTPNFRDTGLFGNELLSRSNLLLLVETILRKLEIERAVMEEADMVEAWRITELLVRDLKNVVESDHAKLIGFMADAPWYYADESESRVKQIFDKLSVPYLETRNAYPDQNAYPDDFDSYWINTHWNRKGQEAVALQLFPQIEPYLPKPD